LYPAKFFQRALIIPLISCFPLALIFRSEFLVVLGIGIWIAALPIYALVAMVMHMLLGKANSVSKMLSIWSIAPIPHTVLQVGAFWLILPSASMQRPLLVVAFLSLVVGYVNVVIVALLYYLLKRVGRIEPSDHMPSNKLLNTDARQETSRAG